MSPTSYQTAPSRDNIIANQLLYSNSQSKEDKGFEPLHGFTRLTVFKTVPFSRTWVILQYETYNAAMDLVGLEPTTGRL